MMEIPRNQQDLRTGLGGSEIMGESGGELSYQLHTQKNDLSSCISVRASLFSWLHMNQERGRQISCQICRNKHEIT